MGTEATSAYRHADRQADSARHSAECSVSSRPSRLSRCSRCSKLTTSGRRRIGGRLEGPRDGGAPTSGRCGAVRKLDVMSRAGADEV
jgi:hypothetical protein